MNKHLEYKNFRIRKICKNDLNFLLNLRNHPETSKYLGTNVRLTMQSQAKWFHSLKNKKDQQYFIFEIFENSWTKIGMVRTHDIDLQNKSMGVGGDILPSFRGNGYAKIMYNLIFQFSFKFLKMHKIWLYVLEYNERARALYKKVGFKEQGILRDAVLKNKKYYDYILMDLIAGEEKYLEH